MTLLVALSGLPRGPDLADLSGIPVVYSAFDYSRHPVAAAIQTK
jgi:hypothetical protein